MSNTFFRVIELYLETHCYIYRSSIQKYFFFICNIFLSEEIGSEEGEELPLDTLNEGDTSNDMQRQYSLNDFELIRVIGRGSYAKVLMVELKRTKRIYAMKVIKKSLVTDDEDIDWVQTEKHVFETASNHPFLVGLHSCFQTPSRLFFVIEFVRGGDLMFHMQRQRRLPEDHARFYVAEISLALNFLHEKGKEFSSSSHHHFSFFFSFFLFFLFLFFLFSLSISFSPSFFPFSLLAFFFFPLSFSFPFFSTFLFFLSLSFFLIVSSFLLLYFFFFSLSLLFFFSFSLSLFYYYAIKFC